MRGQQQGRVVVRFVLRKQPKWHVQVTTTTRRHRKYPVVDVEGVLGHAQEDADENQTRKIDFSFMDVAAVACIKLALRRKSVKSIVNPEHQIIIG